MTNTNIKNILIIGRTGSGKSTLANVITGTNEFREGEGITSETKRIKTEYAEISGIKYRIIDTVGIGDTEMEDWELLCETAKMTYWVKNGLSRIFFLTDSSGFTKDTKESYELLKKFFFDENMAQYTTIVRTHFPSFKNKSRWKEERKKILEVNGDFSELIEEAEIICVDNPPIDVEEKEEEMINKEKRNKSKIILKEHLEKIFENVDTVSEEDSYKPENLNKLVQRIESDTKLKEVLRNEENGEEKEDLELEKFKGEISKKTLQHIVEIDSNFSKRERIEEQLKNLESKVEIVYTFTF